MDDLKGFGGISNKYGDSCWSSGDIEPQLGELSDEVREEQASIPPKKIYTTPSFLYSCQEDDHLSPERLREYSQLRHAISELESQTHNPRPSSSFNYEDEFKAFQEAETELWLDRGVERPVEELVPASGNITGASLAHRLHNPSFTTTKVRNGSTADSSNPCTALVMANGFDDKIIMVDHVVRREVKDPFVYYPEDILACHEQHLSIVRDHMLAPVEVIYGAPTWDRTMKYLQGRLQPLDLWGSYKGIRLFLEWDSVETADCTRERRLRRFLIAAFHPQNLLRAWSNCFKAAQDKMLEVAYDLAEVEFVPHFFEANMWQKQVDILPYAHFAANKPLERESKLALKALHELRLMDTDPEVRKKSTRLHNRLTSELEREVRIRGHQASPEALFTPKSLSPSASKTILWPRKFAFAWSHLLRDRGDLGDVPPEVSVVCILCWGATVVGPERCAIGIDPNPRWTNTAPAKYVERRLCCQNCGFRRRFIPVDEKIPSISEDAIEKFCNSVLGFSRKTQLEKLQEQRPSSRHHRWQRTAAKTTSNKEKTSRKKGEMPRTLKSEDVEPRQDKGPVRTKCTLCHEEGPVNYHPQWLVGSDVYLARRTYKCMSVSCVGAARHLIPMDEGIEYMTQKTLETHARKGSSRVEILAKSSLRHRQNHKP